MKKILLIILLISTGLCKAQNYQCLQSGVKHYFMNENNYLRGVAIDSVKSFADSSIFYPFRTRRGTFVFGTYPGNKGGNWLGDKVIARTDGNFLFLNIWSDTVVIKSQANVGDSWVFYDDTSIRSYTATVLSVDTMTILDSLDSIKTIQINAYSTGVLNPGDSLNTFQIKLSKNHGFVQVFDLYTFPYHFVPGPNADFFHRWITNGTYFFSNEIFKLIKFHNPTLSEIHDYSPGDFFERKTITPYASWLAPCLGTNYNDLFIDSVVAKIILDPLHTRYIMHHRGYVVSVSGYATYDFTDSFDVSSTSVFYSLLPEQYPEYKGYYYFPSDSSLCFHSALYKTIGPDFSIDDVKEEDYKEGFGLVRKLIYEPGTFGCEGMVIDYRDDKLIFASKNGDSCGTYEELFPTSDSSAFVSKLAYHSITCQLYPNPATNELTIKTSNTQPCTIILLNVMGQAVQTIHTNKQETTIDVSHLPAGVYNVSITDEDGNRYNDKVVVVR